MTNVKILKNLDNFLSKYPSSERSVYFEKLISESISDILKLPHYTGGRKYIADKHYVHWQGMSAPLIKSPPGGADSIGYCHGYNLLIEATLLTNATQNTREYGAAIRHYEEFVRNNPNSNQPTYILFITKNLHSDTFYSIKGHLENPRYHSVIVPVDSTILAEILDMMSFSFTAMHVDFRKILNNICSEIRGSDSLIRFNSKIKANIKIWRQNILETEKSACLSFMVYQILKGRGDHTSTIQTSDIYARVKDHSSIKKINRILDNIVTDKTIEKALIDNGFARILTRTYGDVAILEFVPYWDIKRRYECYNQKLESI